MFIKC